MLEDMSKDALFYNYYTQWIEVYNIRKMQFVKPLWQSTG